MLSSVVSTPSYKPTIPTSVGGCSDTTVKAMLVFGACLALAVVVLVGTTDVKEDRIILRDPPEVASFMCDLTDLLRAMLKN